MADPTLIVKKYGNRRLYDTERSQYITLDNLAELIKSGRDVKVVDAKTSANLTKMVLLQIITEQEKEKDLLPVSFLKQMIQLGDTGVRESLQRYLSLSLDTFLNAQHDVEARYRNMAGNMMNPGNLMNPMMWLMPPYGQTPGGGAPTEGMTPPMAQMPQMPQMPQGMAPPPEPPLAPKEPPPEVDPTPPPDEPTPSAASDDDTKEQVQALKAQVDQIQQMLSKLGDK
jgi:polyhydroxyalkanoate synthesis repressor PhaR